MGNNKLGGNGGLAVDDATLERVADAIMDSAHPPPWQPLTAENAATVPPLPQGKVQDYLAEHELIADVDVGWHGGKRTIVVGTLGDPEPHRTPLKRTARSRVIVWHTGRPPRRIHTGVGGWQANRRDSRPLGARLLALGVRKR